MMDYIMKKKKTYKRKKRGPVQAKKVTYDGIKFASGLERYMYQALKKAKIKAVYEGATFEVVEESADSLSIDTVTYANTVAPEYCTINLSEPGSGLISFYSEDFADISLIHDLTSCEGDTLFP